MLNLSPRYHRSACLVFLFNGASMYAQINTTQNGAISLTASPVQFTSLGFYSGYTAGTKVQRIAFRVIPGFCGKLYVGNSIMTTASFSTYAGVFKVIYPNCSGGLSDEYKIEDLAGTNGIDAAQFYVMGQSAGDVIAWDTFQTSGGPAATLLHPVVGPGPVPNTTAFPVHVGTVAAAIMQFNVVPGMTGKIRVFGASGFTVHQPDQTYTGIKKVLWPNNGQNVTDG